MVCEQMSNTIKMDSLESGDVKQVSESEIAEFLVFLNEREDYLDTGLGAFHTDDHSNW